MRKRVGIITILDNVNYGNRLQNYAMEQLLMNLGFETYTIPHIYFEDWYYLHKDVVDYMRQQLYKKSGLCELFTD
jgi:hypothetical protein